MSWLSDMIQLMDNIAVSSIVKRMEMEDSMQLVDFYRQQTLSTNPAYLFSPKRITDFVYEVGESLILRDYLDEVITIFLMKNNRDSVTRLIRHTASVMDTIMENEGTILPSDWATELGSSEAITQNFLTSNKWYLVTLLLSLKEHKEEQNETFENQRSEPQGISTDHKATGSDGR